MKNKEISSSLVFVNFGFAEAIFILESSKPLSQTL